MPTATRNKETKNTFNLPRGEAIRRELVTWFRKQRRVVLDFLQRGQKDVGDPVPDVPTWDDLKLGNLAMSERFVPLIETIWDQAGQKFTSSIGLDPDSWDVTNPKTQEAIDALTLDFCTATNETTSMDLHDAVEEVRKAVRDGLITGGQSIDALTERVNAIFDGAEKWRARRIAVTESSRAVHEAQLLQGKESGVVTGWRWLASSDACPLCQKIAADAKHVKLDQPFAVIGDHPAYSSIRSPPGHPHCQCTMVPVLDIDEQPHWAETLIQPQAEEPKPEPIDVEPLPPKVAKPKPAPKRKKRNGTQEPGPIA